jgi:hypothetical protein
MEKKEKKKKSRILSVSLQNIHLIQKKAMRVNTHRKQDCRNKPSCINNSTKYEWISQVCQEQRLAGPGGSRL